MHLVIFGLLVSFIWGLLPIIDKYILRKIDPKLFVLLFTAFIFGCSIILVLFSRKTIQFKSLDKNTLGLTFLSALFSFGALVVYLLLLKDNDSHLVSAIAYSAPMFTLILALFILKEKPTPISITGILLIILGVWCIAFKN